MRNKTKSISPTSALKLRMLDDRIGPLDADSFDQWQLSTFEKCMLITAVYLGVAIGSYLQIYSDRCSRYSIIFWDTAFQTTFGYYLLSGGVLKLYFSME